MRIDEHYGAAGGPASGVAADGLTNGSRIRVLLADDHPILRSGLKLLLGAEPDLEVVGEATTAREAVDKTVELRPDAVVMDIAIPAMRGLEATGRVSQLGPGTRV